MDGEAIRKTIKELGCQIVRLFRTADEQCELASYLQSLRVECVRSGQFELSIAFRDDVLEPERIRMSITEGIDEILQEKQCSPP